MPKRLTPEEAKALVEKHGSQRAAARATGVSPSTIQYWRDPEHRERQREYRREYQRESYAKAKAHHVCSVCRGELDPASTVYCPTHLEAQRERNFLRIRL